MAVIPWTTLYPATVDTTTQMPDLTDAVDDVHASHPTSLRGPVILLERENTGYKDNTTISAGANVTVDVLDVEVVVGTALLNGANLYHLIPSVRLLAAYNTDGSALDAELRVYDMGSVSAQLIPPVLRSTVVLSTTDDTEIKLSQQTLTVSAAPGTNQIDDSARVYEFRIYIPDDTGPASYVTCYWLGFALGVTQT